MTEIGSHEIERAWQRHDPTRRKVDGDAQRAVRRFKRTLVEPALKINAAVHSPARKRVADDLFRKKGTGRARALKHLQRLLAPARLVRSDPVIFAWLEAGGAVLVGTDDPGHRQDCILVCGAVMRKPRDGDAYSAGFWSLELPDHALGRLLQRDRNADVTAAIWTAHAALHRAGAAELLDCHKESKEFFLPTPAGVFLCEAIVAGIGGGRRMPYGRARTWLAHDMMRPDQQPLAPAAEGSASVEEFLISLLDEDASVIVGGAGPFPLPREMPDVGLHADTPSLD